MNKFAIFNVSLALGLIISLESNCADKTTKPGETIHPMAEALASAYVNNSTLRAKLHETYANDENVSIAISKFRPNIRVSGSVGRASNEINTPSADLDPLIGTRANFRQAFPTKPQSASAEIRQSLYAGGGDLANLWASESGAKAGEYDLFTTEQKTLLDANKAYMQVIYATTAVTLNETNVSYLSEQLKSMKAQVEVGEKTTTDMYTTEAELAKGQSSLDSARSDLGDAKANYLQVIGEQPGLLEYPTPLKSIPKTLQEVIDISLRHNPTILNAVYSAEAAGLTIDVKTAQILPKLDLVGTATRSINQQRFNQDENNNASAVLQLTIPIYQGGEEYSAVRQQAETAAKVRYQLEQARKSVREDATKAWDALVNSREQISDLQTQVKAAASARDGALKEADVGERSYTEVLTFQSQLITAELNLLRARRDEVIAQYGLYAAMGKLTAKELQLSVALYDVEGHLCDVRYKIAGFGETPKILEDRDEQIAATED
jgi:outer membrane protein